MEPAIGIRENDLCQVAHTLNEFLADEFLLYVKTRNAHWNVEGRDFHTMHTFFEEQFNQLDDIIDEVAERIRTLGHFVPATLQLYLELTHLTEQSREKNDSTGFIKELVSDHESIIIRLREVANPIANDMRDIGTNDFITGLIKIHEKMAWMLRAHLSS